MNSSTGSEGTEHPRAEILAAFVDGRLDGDERRKMVEHLDACPDCYEEYAETVRFLQDEEPGGRVVAIGREDRPRSMRPLFWTAAAVAAVLLAVVIVPGLLPGPGIEGEDLGTARLASALESPERAVGRVEPPPGPAGVRGFGPQPLAMFEAGVTVLDLRAALAARDRSKALQASQPLPGRDALQPAIEDERWRDASREVDRIERDLTEGAGAKAFLAGARAEAGRLAAATGDAAFFRSEPGRAAYEALAERLGETPPAPDDLDALEQGFQSWIDNP